MEPDFNNNCDENPNEVQHIINQISVADDVNAIGESMRYSTLQKVNHRIDVSVRRILVLKVSGIAASLVFLLGVTGYFSYQWGYERQNSQLVELVNPLGTKSTVVLSDGTKVTMNAGTTLRYPAVFTSKTRNVEVAGEALFEVAHDAQQPFVVKAGLISTKVLGTMFNIKAYQDDNDIEVTLAEGSIEVESEILDTPILMTPNEQVILDKTSRQVSKHFVNAEHYLAWKEGKCYFRNISFGEIAKRLERSFNVRIIIDSDKLRNTNFTGNFIHGENLERMLRVMTSDKRIDCKIEGNLVFIKEH